MTEDIMDKKGAMSPDEFRAKLDELGITQVEAARFFGVTERSARRWVSGDTPIPVLVGRMMSTLKPSDLPVDQPIDERAAVRLAKGTAAAEKSEASRVAPHREKPPKRPRKEILAALRKQSRRRGVS